MRAAAAQMGARRSFIVCCLFLFYELSRAQIPGVCLPSTPTPALEPFVDPLPIMPRISLANTKASSPLVIGAYKITQKLHRDLPNTTLYAFGTSQETAAVPGPTLVAIKERETHVRWENHITDANHMLPVDPTLDKAQPRNGGVPLVVHQHGGVTVAASDGHPDAWFTNLGDTGPNFTTQNYVYSNAQPPTMLWYHDHTFGYTRLSVPAGLAGLYLIVAKEDPDWLPTKLREPYGRNKLGVGRPYVHPLLIQDKQFYANGSLLYPIIGSFPSTHPNWCIDYFGDVMVVNGKVWPYLDVTRGIHRFRVLNGCNSRFLLLGLSQNMTFLKVGVDGGFLSTPVRQTQVRLAPGERADVIIDFSGLQSGANVTMENTAPAPFPDGTPPVNSTVMLFRVGSRKGPLWSSPTGPVTLPPPQNRTIESTILQTTGLNVSAVNLDTIKRRQFTVAVGLNQTDGAISVLFLNTSQKFRDPPTEIVNVYDTELWELVNNVAAAAHPIHIHLINFVVLNQQRYNQSRFMNNNCSFSVSFPDPSSCFTEAPQLPDDDHLGWKDIAIIQPFSVTRFLVPFLTRDRTTFPFDPTAAPGYVWHCHILEHEDNEMMRPLLFVNGNNTSS